MTRAARLTLSPTLEEFVPPPPPGLQVRLSLRVILVASLLLNVFYSALAGYWLYKHGGLARFTMKDISGINRMDYVMAKRDLYREADRLRRDTRPNVMFGDSLTGGGLWEEWFSPNTLNRGIGGEDTREALARAGDIATLHPARVFIMLGTNDFSHITPQETRRNIASIIQTIQEASPQSEIFLESLLPAPERDRELWVREVNSALQSVAEEKHVRWISLFQPFAKDDFIIRKYTLDGVHLSPQGYEVWRRLLKPYMTASSAQLRELQPAVVR